LVIMVADDRAAGQCIEAWRSLLLAQDAVLRAIEADLKRASAIPLTWYDVLLELNAAPQHRLRMADLAARTVLSRTRISRLVDELIAEGYVLRRPDPDDGRASFAVLTPKGRTALRKAAPVYLAGIQRHFTDHLDDAERTALVRALNKVVIAHRSPR
jgi:DNA-binding MarR family transcriptional regulator